MRRFVIACALLAASIWAPSAHARPDAQGRPFGKGTIVPRLGFGFGYGSELLSLRWGVAF